MPELLDGLRFDAVLRLGSRELTLGDAVRLQSGAGLRLDRQIDEMVELVVSGRVVARGEIVIVNGNYAFEVTEVAPEQTRKESVEWPTSIQ